MDNRLYQRNNTQNSPPRWPYTFSAKYRQRSSPQNTWRGYGKLLQPPTHSAISEQWRHGDGMN